MLGIRLAVMQLRMPMVATTIAALVIGTTAWSMVPEMFAYDPEPDTYHFVLPYVYDCDPLSIEREGSITRNPIKWWLNCTSYQLTGNYKLFPAALGIAIMPLVYLLGSYMTNDRLIGLISLTAFINNPLYTDWVTSGTYDQVWAFLLILGCVLLFRGHTNKGIISFVGALGAKALAFLYVPAFMYSIWKKTHNLTDIMMFLLAISLAGFIATSALGLGGLVGNQVGFYPERWEDAVYRNISVLWQVIPFAVFVMLNRSFIPKMKMPNQGTVAIWLLMGLLQNPLIYLFTMQDTYSYRYVPFAAFMSVFIGMTIVNLGNWLVERRLAIKLPDL